MHPPAAARWWRAEAEPPAGGKAWRWALGCVRRWLPSCEPCRSARCTESSQRPPWGSKYRRPPLPDLRAVEGPGGMAGRAAAAVSSLLARPRLLRDAPLPLCAAAKCLRPR